MYVCVPVRAAGALPDTTGKYKCIPCSRPNQRACECTHEAVGEFMSDPPRPCDLGLTHWCLYEPEYVVTTGSDGLEYCMHNASNTALETVCGTEGHEACLNVTTGIFSCTSPDAQNTTVSAMRAHNDPTDTVMCIACGKKGLEACACATLPPGVCDVTTGSTFHCETGTLFQNNGMLMCG